MVGDVSSRVGADVSEATLRRILRAVRSTWVPSCVKVYLAGQPVDFRQGPDSLLSLGRDAGSDSFSGALYVFRAKRADRVKCVWWGGTGVCLFAKRLEKSSFC